MGPTAHAISIRLLDRLVGGRPHDRRDGRTRIPNGLNARKEKGWAMRRVSIRPGRLALLGLLAIVASACGSTASPAATAVSTAAAIRTADAAATASPLIPAVAAQPSATSVQLGSPCTTQGATTDGPGGARLFCATAPDGRMQWVFGNQGAQSQGGNQGPQTQGGGSGGTGGSGSHPIVPAGPVIDTLPFDLASVTQISKYRSCAGHDYSGQDTDFKSETMRSMKHYIYTRGEASLKLSAPFNGVIAWIIPEGAASANAGFRVVVEKSDGAGGLWDVVFMHVEPLPGMAVGTSLLAGQQFANTSAPRLNWDFGLQWIRPGIGQQDPRQFSGLIFESPLLRLSPALAAQFAARGVTPDNIILSPAARDASPCVVYEVRDNVTYFKSGPADVVTLR